MKIPPSWDERDYKLSSDIRSLPSYGRLPSDDHMVSMQAVLKLLVEHAEKRGNSRRG